MHRIQKSDRDASECFIQDNYYYLCDVEEEVVSQRLDHYEAEEMYRLEYVDPKVAISTNRNNTKASYHTLMLERESRVLESLLTEGLLE